MRWAERIKQHGLTMHPDAVATEKVATKGKTVRLGVKPTQLSGNETVILDSVTKRYGSRTLFENVTALIRRGERSWHCRAERRGEIYACQNPARTGDADRRHGASGASVTVGYFAQDTSDLDLDATVLDNMLDVADMKPEEARTHLGKFLFTGDDVFRQVRLLSGGEKNKLVLAQLTYLRPNLLILDEPTNHLDLD